jgi:drug/metabolite transporter (DMT)-like permease
MSVGGLMLFLASYMIGEFQDLASIQISSKSFIAFLYLILLCTVVGHTEFLWLLKVEPAT